MSAKFASEAAYGKSQATDGLFPKRSLPCTTVYVQGAFSTPPLPRQDVPVLGWALRDRSQLFLPKAAKVRSEVRAIFNSPMPAESLAHAASPGCWVCPEPLMPPESPPAPALALGGSEPPGQGLPRRC